MVDATDIDTLVGRFLSRTLPKSEWTHQAHLVVGAWHVDRYGPDEALTRLRDGIRALNDSHGTVNSDSSGYHETITRAYARLIARAFASGAGPLPDRIARILSGPEGERDALLRYYSREQLMSAHARAEWVEPDLKAAPLTPRPYFTPAIAKRRLM
jgi:hypothetical protein